jgi:nucleoside-diphosphate-sugar epimerase
MSGELHVIFGTGPVGVWTARALREAGLAVRAVNRSGHRPALMPAEVEVVAADAADAVQATAAAAGASVVYQALNPPYHQWPQFFPGLQAGALTAAERVGARYVSIDNLYMYSPVSGPIREDSPQRPTTVKGRLRKQMADEVLEAHSTGRVSATVLRSADYYGPGVLGSALGERTFGPLVVGKKAEVMGSADQPHSFAYIEDVGRAAATLGTSEASWGRVWIGPHAAAVTQRQMLQMAAATAGQPLRIRTLGPAMLRVGGLFIPEAKSGVEMLYEFTAPFVVDDTSFTTEFGWSATPTDVGLASTVTWFREHGAAG